MFLWIQSPAKTTPPMRRNRPLEEAEAPKRKKASASNVRIGKVRLSQGLVILAAILGLLAVLALVNRYQQEVTLSDVEVSIEALKDNTFMNENRVMEAMGWMGGVAPIGAKMKAVHLKVLEDSLKKSPFVKDAEIYKSIQGVLHVDVAMREPVARLMNNSGADVYLDPDGIKFPVSSLHSANVVLVRGDFDEAVADTFSCETVLAALPVLNFIHRDSYWNNYFSEVKIEGDGELILIPRRDNMDIEFGYPVRVAEKFTSLKAFLSQVMPHADRPRFKQISVKYKGQVVASKR